MPEFATEKSTVIDRHIADAASEFDVARWGGLYARGLRNWVAHSIVMEKARIAAGPAAMAGDLTSMTLINANGQVSKATDAGSVERRQANPYLESTYGKEYVRLRRIVGMGGVAV